MGRPIQTILPTQQLAAGDRQIIGFTNDRGLNVLFYVVIQTTQGRLVEKIVIKSH